MPVVKPHPLTRVLVTGANGHTGMWVVRALLEQGYSVRCAVRSLEKGRRLRHCFYSHGARVEIIVVHDITKVGFLNGLKFENAEIGSTQLIGESLRRSR
jgi:nucleoside-diphosphate-sugar epimerase